MEKKRLDDERRQLVLDHFWLVRAVIRQGPWPEWDREDLMQVGFIGLIDAALKYDPQHESSFSSYAPFRIRGAIVDYQRREDCLTRCERRVVRVFEREGCSISREAIAIRLGLDVEAVDAAFLVNDYARDTNSDQLLEEIVLDSSPDQAEVLFGSELVQIVRQAINDEGLLSEMERNVIRLYHFEDMTLAKVGQELGVSESRAWQLNRKALFKLKKRLGFNLAPKI